MIINITSSTFFLHDSGEVEACSPLDFVLNINHSTLSFYSLKSTIVKEVESNNLWNIIEKGRTESHGLDSALGRTLTIINVSGMKYQNWRKEELCFEITLNHHHGLGASEIVNNLVHSMKSTIQNLNPIDINFLNEIANIENNETQHFV